MKRFMIIFLSVWVFSSCSDWLDVQPKTTVEEEKVFSRELGFKEALAGAYIKMVSTDLYAENLSYGFLDILGQRYQPDILEGYQDELWYTFPSVKTESYTEVIWEEMYNIIANLNNLLYYCDKNRQVFAAENYYEIIKGEALGLRAFLHFDLLRMYGPIYKDNPTSKCIVYRTQFNNMAEALQPSTVVIDSIVSDLKKAEALLTSTDPLNFEFPTDELEEEEMFLDAFLSYRHKRMNLYAVKALLARVYLYAGDKENAAIYAQEVIDSKLFELVVNADDLLRSKEIIFSVYVDDFAQQVLSKFETSGSFYINDEDFLYEMFDVANDGTNDVRIREGVSFDFSAHGISTRKYNQDMMWPSTEGTVVLIRLAEMYYILAECTENPEDAASYLNKVREVRGADPIACNEANRLAEIEKEYRKEFYGEGQLFFFYKRHGYETFLHSPENMKLTEKNYMFSLPENEELFGLIN